MSVSASIAKILRTWPERRDIPEEGVLAPFPGLGVIDWPNMVEAQRGAAGETGDGKQRRNERAEGLPPKLWPFAP